MKYTHKSKISENYSTEVFVCLLFDKYIHSYNKTYSYLFKIYIEK